MHSQAFIKNIQNTAHAYKLWKRGSRIIIGVSGGPDSVCLLHILARLAPKYDLSLHIAHINYGLRGDDSDADCLLVQKLAQQYAIPLSVHTTTVTPKANVEAKLRDIRYNFFETIRQEHGFDTIAIAHNQNDQAETLLMRLIRGSGLSGLSAMNMYTNHIIRPLLHTSRADIMRYIEQEQLLFRIDASNTDPHFLRNRIRHHLIPYLENDFNPHIQATLAQTAALIGEEYATLETLTQTHTIPCTHAHDTISFHVHDLKALPVHFRSSVLRNLIKTLRHTLKDISHTHIQEILRMLLSTKNKHKEISCANINVFQKGDLATISLQNTQASL